MSDSDFSSSESEEKIFIDNVNPTLDDLFPLELHSSLFTPPLSSLKLSARTKMQIKNILKTAPAQELRKVLFWQVFCKKLKDSFTSEVQEVLKSLLSQAYSSLMLLKIKENFDEAMDVLPLLFGHSIHYELWDIFKHSKHLFDLRFCVDCYKIVYFNLFGIKVSDIFVRSATQRVMGDYFMHYNTRKSKPKHSDKKHVLSKALEEKMEKFPGGKEFARELFYNVPHIKHVIKIDKNDIRQPTLEPSDQVLQERVEKHMSEPPLKKSFLDKETDKTFNCVKLSPMICGYIDSSTKQVPFKVRHMTPHKSQVIEESAPYYVKLLKQHCDEKRSQSANKIRREIERSKRKKTKITGIDHESQSEILTGDPRNAKCFEEVFKLQSKLNDAFPIKLLFTNKSKYGL